MLIADTVPYVRLNVNVCYCTCGCSTLNYIIISNPKVKILLTVLTVPISDHVKDTGLCACLCRAAHCTMCKILAVKVQLTAL